MAKVTLTDLGSLTNEQSALNVLNNNNDALETFSDSVLSRNGASPNQMETVLDMNSNRVINVGQPVNDNDAARLKDLKDIVAGDVTTITGAVRYDTPQALSPSQQSQARSNIGAQTVDTSIFVRKDIVDPMTSGQRTNVRNALQLEGMAYKTSYQFQLDGTAAPYPVDEYLVGDASGRANYFIQSNYSGNVTGLERYTLFVGNYSSGTGDGTVVGSTYGLGISALKTNWTFTQRQGQTHGLSIVTRGGYHGTDPNLDYNYGDTASIVCNTVVSSIQSASIGIEGTAYYGVSGSTSADGALGIRYQIGTIRKKDNPGIGFLGIAMKGTLSAAFQAQPNGADGNWPVFLRNVVWNGSGYTETFSVDDEGTISINGQSVVTARKLGWSQPSGTMNRGTYATSTVTVEQLAQFVYALWYDLAQHGLVG